MLISDLKCQVELRYKVQYQEFEVSWSCSLVVPSNLYISYWLFSLSFWFLLTLVLKWINQISN